MVGTYIHLLQVMMGVRNTALDIVCIVCIIVCSMVAYNTIWYRHKYVHINMYYHIHTVDLNQWSHLAMPRFV